MNNPLISVIVTTYNREHLLRETLISILNQTYKNVEIIVIDNFSNYDFFGLINSFDDKRLIGIQNNNFGIIALNRNLGIKKSLGEILAFCDDDDVWIEDKLQKQIEIYYKKNIDNEKILIHSNTILFGDNLNDISTKKSNIINFNDIINGNQLSFSTVILTNTSSVFFDENIILKASEDYNLWVNLYFQGYKFYLIQEPLVKYRVSLNSASSPNREYNSLRIIFILISNILKYKPQKFSYSRLFLRINILLFKYVILKLRK